MDNSTDAHTYALDQRSSISLAIESGQLFQATNQNNRCDKIVIEVGAISCWWLIRGSAVGARHGRCQESQAAPPAPPLVPGGNTKADDKLLV